jgi:hypothetical protein
MLFFQWALQPLKPGFIYSHPPTSNQVHACSLKMCLPYVPNDNQDYFTKIISISEGEGVCLGVKLGHQSVYKGVKQERKKFFQNHAV